MLRYLLQNPDALALALLLLLVGLTLTVGLVAGRRADRRASEAAAPERAALVTSWPHLLRRELLASLITLLLVCWWAMALELPLDVQAAPDVTPRVIKAPWFFVGVQELLQYFDPWLAGVVLPALLLIGLAALPYLDHRPAASDYTMRRPLALTLIILLSFGWLALMVVGLFFRGEAWLLQPAWRPQLPDLLPASSHRTLADALHLSSGVGRVLGGVVCLGPLLTPLLLWPRLRRRPWAAEIGLFRSFLAWALLWLCLLVAIKVLLVTAADIRYLWVMPWFRV